MLFGTNQKLSRCVDLDVTYNGVQVENVSKFKYIGVMLDQSPKFDEHVKYVKRKVYTKMKALGKLRQYISQTYLY